MIAFDAMRGQLKLGLRVEVRKETLLEEMVAFVKGLVSYAFSRVCGFFRFSWGSIVSGSSLASEIKFYVQRKLYRRKGQLAFPLAHASLLGVSFSLLLFTSGFGEFLYRQVGSLDASGAVAIVSDRPSVATEESELLKTEVQEYMVESGDTLYDLAERFRVSVDALAYANELSEPYMLHPGDKLAIPPVEGLVYKVKKGDTVEKVAKKYEASAQSIVEFNYLFPPYDLEVGAEIIVPNAQVPQPKPVIPQYSSQQFAGGYTPSPSGACNTPSLIWPSASRQISQYYWYGHRAIDIAGNVPLYASASGKVVYAGWKPYGYGQTVWINIGGGLQVRYAHMAKISVGVGQQVSAGRVIGVSGNTGWAYGSHLHFELLCNGTKINPLPYLH
jgi:murein DD-endopeptidase MepM/ murein hydrolase activator NlpD